MRHEVAADKEHEHHPVINSHFQIERERSIVHIQLGFELLLQNGNIKENDTSTTSAEPPVTSLQVQASTIPLLYRHHDSC
jgi:hypothetical protein